MSVSSAMVHRLERLGDRFNPIVVKEVRQALKSRQFVATFLLLLLAAWAGSIFGVSFLGESIDYGSSAVAFYAGFLLALCTATLVIVPFSTFRSIIEVLVSQGRERTASGPAGEIWPVGSVGEPRITRESRAERPLTPSG